LDSIAFQQCSHKLNPEARTNQAAHSHTHSYQKLLQFSFPLLRKSLIYGIPLIDSQELIRLQFCPVGWDLTESWLSLKAYWVWMKLPGKLAHFFLESSWGKTTQSVGTPGKGGHRIPLGGTPPCLAPSPSLHWCCPATSWFKEPEWLVSCWDLQKCCGNIFRQETKWHSEK
jgi:hypothetical protein